MAVEILEPTTFPLDTNDALAPYHRLINAYLGRIPSEGFVGTSTVYTRWDEVRALHLEAAQPILELPVEQQFGCIRASARFSYWSRFEWGWASNKPETKMQMGYEGALDNLCANILSSEREWSEDEIEEMIIALDTPYAFDESTCITSVVEKYLAHHPVTASLRASIEVARDWNARLHRLPQWLTLGEALGEPLVLQRGERWADEAIAFIQSQPEAAQNQWRDFLLHCVGSEKTKPSAKWLSIAEQYLDKIGLGDFEEPFVVWCKRYGQSLPSHEINQAVFKGLVWSALLVPSQQVAKSIADIALSCTKANATTISFFSLSLFNACIWSLSQLPVLDAKELLVKLAGQVQNKRFNALDKALEAIEKRASDAA